MVHPLLPWGITILERGFNMPDDVPDMEAIRDDPIGVALLEQLADWEREHLLEGSQQTWSAFLDEYYAPLGGKTPAACVMYRLVTVLNQVDPMSQFLNPGNLGTILNACIMAGVELARRQQDAIADLEQAWNAPEYGQLVPKPGRSLGEGEWTGRGYDHA